MSLPDCRPANATSVSPPAGGVLAAIGMAMLTGIGAGTTYVASVLPALLVTGLGSGFIFGPVQNAATSGFCAAMRASRRQW